MHGTHPHTFILTLSSGSKVGFDLAELSGFDYDDEVEVNDVTTLHETNDEVEVNDITTLHETDINDEVKNHGLLINWTLMMTV